MYYDSSYIFIILGAVIALACQFYLKSTYAKYKIVRNKSGITGAMVANLILQNNNITDVTVSSVAGELTDHYNPQTKVVNLSRDIYNGSTIASVGVAAHECGHVLQHHNGYWPLSVRTSLVPLVNIGSNLSMPIILLGCLFSYNMTMIQIGIALFSFAVLFQLVTLPVEFDASRRALVMLEEYGVLEKEENAGARKVLTAAALTYVAAALNSIIQLLRLIYIFGGRRRD